MSSSYKQLLKDIEFGREEGEVPIQKFFLDKFGVVTENVGRKNLGWDLQLVEIQAEFFDKPMGKGALARHKKKFISKFGETFEIKRDKRSDTSNNIYWECWSNYRVKNPGCQLECKADTIIFVRKQEFIFLNRAMFLGWFYENLFMRTPLSDVWRKTTFKSGRERMMVARSNSDVRGVLLPVDTVKNSVACFHVEQRNL